MEGVNVPVPAQPQKFFDQFRAFIRLDGKSYATENTYVYWVRQYILYHRKRHPNSMGKDEVTSFLSHLSHPERITQHAKNCLKRADVSLQSVFTTTH